MFEYVVKVICGVFTREEDILATGQYWTAINVYNPAEQNKVELRVRIAIAFPSGAGPSFDTPPLGLGPQEALEIDCDYVMGNARELANYDRRFLKGFVIIRSKLELDVVAVYTASGRDDSVVTLEIERVAPRTI